MTNMRIQVTHAIRDSRSLTSDEKLLLMMIESRGVYFGRWETLAADCGWSKNTLYRWRRSCIDKGVLNAEERPGRSTRYLVNADWFQSCGDPSQNLVTVDGSDPSQNLVTVDDPSQNLVTVDESDPSQNLVTPLPKTWEPPFPKLGNDPSQNLVMEGDKKGSPKGTPKKTLLRVSDLPPLDVAAVVAGEQESGRPNCDPYSPVGRPPERLKGYR